MKLSTLGVVAVVPLLLCSPVKAQVNPGVFFDFKYKQDEVDPAAPRFSPMPSPGLYTPATSANWLSVFNAANTAGLPVGFTLRNPTGPVNGTATGPAPTKKDTLDSILSFIPKLDYLTGDIELSVSATEADMTAMVNKVRANSNNAIKGSRVGNYGYYPGTSAHYLPYPGGDRTAYHNAYINSGVDTAYPSCYPASASMLHADAGTWGAYGGVTPNVRSGLFWACLEKFSYAKRNLPAGHKIIPYVEVFLPNKDYYAEVPPKADGLALIQHYRMRGADGIYRYNTGDWIDPDPTQEDANGDADYKWTNASGVPVAYRGTYFIPHNSWLYTYTPQQHRADIVAQWTALDSMFGAPIRTLLNLNTNKTAGVEWSGVRSVNTVKILVSNLSSTAQTVSLTGTDYAYNGGIPAATASVTAGTHQMFTYTMTNLVANPDFNTNITGWYLLLGSTRETTGGVGNSACIKTQNTSMAATGTQNIRTEPGAKMSIKVSAKGTSAPRLMLGFYTFDAAGNNIGFFIVGDHTGVPTTFTDYTDVFNVPSNASIKYIKPIIYNYGAPTDSSDVLWIDDVVVKFAS